MLIRRKLAPRALAGLAALTTAAAALAQPANDQCADAAAITLGTPVNGTTVNAVLDFSPSCTNDSADVYYVFTPTTTASYLVTVTGESNENLSLSLLTGCEFPIGEYGCVTGNPKGPRIETLIFEGGPVIVRVGSTVAQAFTVSAGFAPPPANDECAGAIALTPGVPVQSNNLSATTSVELPNAALCSSIAPGIAGGADVFFSFTPDQDGFYDFSTCGAENDTVVSVHSGCPVTAANAIACNDNAPLSACPETFDTHSSYVAGVQMTAGVTYYVRVAGVLIYNPFTKELEGPSRGRFEISATFGFEPVVPANDTCATAEVLFPDSSTLGSTVNATSDGPGACGEDDVWDVWYTFTSSAADRRAFQFAIPPGSFNASATMTVYDACGGDVILCQAFNPFSNPDMMVWVAMDPGQTIKLRIAGQLGTQDQFSLATFTGGAGATNVSCATAQAVAAGETVTADTNGANSDVTGPCGFADTSPLWYSFTATTAGYYRVATDFFFDPKAFDRTTLTVYSECGGEPLVCTVQGDAFSTNPRAAALALRFEAGQTRYFRASYEAPVRNVFDFSVTGPLPAPPAVPNDACANATNIGAFPFHAEVDITLATPDQDVCAFEGEPLFPTPGGIWYTTTASVERVFRGVVNTTDGAQGRATVFTGSCGALAQVSCGGTTPGDPGVVLEAGVTYHILVSLAPFRDEPLEEIPYGTTLVVDLVALPRPANDDCATAQRITSSDAVISVNTLPADADGPLPSCIGFGGALQNAVWYTLTPSTPGTLEVNGEGVNPQEGLYSPGGVLYRGTCGKLVEVTCDSPRNGFFITRHFEFTAELEAGVTYYMAVGTWARPLGGETEITIAYSGQLGCEADFNGDGVLNSQDFFNYLTAFFANDPSADFNTDGQVNSQDFFDFLQAFFVGCD